MKKVIKLCVLVLLPFVAFNQSIEWKKCYGGSDEERAYKIIPCSNQEFLIIGQTKSSDGDVSANQGSSDYWLVKIDANGDILWEKTFGGSFYESAYDITGTNDGGFIIAGKKNYIDGMPTNSDFWIIKINSDGNMVWENTYGGSNFDIPSNIIATDDNGFIVAGVTFSDDGDITGNESNKWAAWIIKINASGTLVWEKTFLISDCINFGGIIGTPQDGMIFTADICESDSDFIIIRLDSEGEVVWEKTYGGSLNDVPHAIAKGYEYQGYFIVGKTASEDGDIIGNHGSFDFWLLQIDDDGELVNSHCYGGSDPDIPFDISPLGNNELLIAGVTESDDGDVKNEDDFGDFWIINTAYDGTLNWEISLGDSIGRDVATSILPIGTDGFIVAGYTCTEGGEVVTGNHGAIDFWVVKFDLGANYTSKIPLGGNIDLFPNPSSDYLTLEGTAISRVEMVDLNGRIMRQFYNNFDKLDSPGYLLDYIQSGYFTEHGAVVHKVVIE
jgi:hypothetical protein